MAKAAELNIDLNEPAHHQPPAATAPRTTTDRKQGRGEPAKPKNDTPVNFRWPAAEVKSLKKAALEADMTLQDFLLSCFHTFVQKNK